MTQNEPHNLGIGAHTCSSQSLGHRGRRISSSKQDGVYPGNLFEKENNELNRIDRTVTKNPFSVFTVVTTQQILRGRYSGIRIPVTGHSPGQPKR